MQESLRQCPVCSRTIAFQHSDINFAVCTCGSAIQRSKDGSLVKSDLPVIKENDSIVQPGTTGTWNGLSFTVYGRMRCWMLESVFNYWTILFSDGQLGYLGEGYGIYAIYRKSDITDLLTSFQMNNLKTGEKMEIGTKKYYLLERRHKCEQWDLEGQASFPMNKQRQHIIELSSEQWKHIEFIEFDHEVIAAFDVIYCSYDSLTFNNTRSSGNTGMEFICSKCKETIRAVTYPYAQSCSCTNKKCGAWYTLRGKSYVAHKERNNTDIGPEIELGTSGIINGITYQVIGFALKEEKNEYRSQWKEYTLYNQQHGFAFLSEYNGHWIFIRENCDSPVVYNYNRADFLEKDYERFEVYNDYKFDVVNAFGEFPYNIFNDEGTRVREFIAPPEVWMVESSGHEGITWYHGEHVDRKKIINNFNFPGGPPSKQGVGAVEPKGYINTGKMLVGALVAFLVLLILQGTLNLTHKKQVLLSENLLFVDSTHKASYVSEKLDLDVRMSNLRFYVAAQVSNSWVELNANLVNADNGAEYALEKGVEYYSGYSDGEFWTEGSTTEYAWLSQVPRGKYILQIEVLREGGWFQSQSSEFQPQVQPQLQPQPMFVPSVFVEVIYDVQSDRNIYICAGILLFIFVIKFLWVKFNERRRWSNSPFSPYEQDDE